MLSKIKGKHSGLKEIRKMICEQMRISTQRDYFKKSQILELKKLNNQIENFT